MSDRYLDDVWLHGPRLPWPVVWTAVFGRHAPLWAEIGFGNGAFLLEMAQRERDRNWIGLEISLPSLRRAARKVRSHDLSNVRLVQGDATLFLEALCAPRALSGLFVNFPDPWPKAAHHARRLIQPRFLRLLAGRLCPDAPLRIATDHTEYANWIGEQLAADPHFDSRYAAPFVTEDPERIRTKYEEKALAAGRVCHYFHWRRNETAVSPPIPIPQEYPMPHVVLHSPLTLEEVARRFCPFFISEANAGVKYIDLLHAQGGPYLLVETYVNETPMSQRVGLSIRARASGDWVVSLHAIGFPRPTAGMHRAVYHLAQWVAGLHPDTAIVTTSLQGAALEEKGDKK